MEESNISESNKSENLGNKNAHTLIGEPKTGHTSQTLKEKSQENKIEKFELSARHSMREIRIGKIVVNISVGQSGEPLNKSMVILENLTGQRPFVRRAKQTIRTFGIRRNEPMACMVTLRGVKANNFLKKAFTAVGNKINPHNFDKNGNFAFGIREHIDLPGQRYDPNLGITGMDVMATIERPGYRVARRRRLKSKIGSSHKVTREEAIDFITERFGVEVGLSSEY